MQIGLMRIHLVIFVMERTQVVVLFHLQFVKMMENIQEISVNVYQDIMLIMTYNNVVRKEINVNFEK
jgi:hypothetical protein